MRRLVPWLEGPRGKRGKRRRRSGRRRRREAERDKKVSCSNEVARRGRGSVLRPIKSFPRDRTVGESVREGENRSIGAARVAAGRRKSRRATLSSASESLPRWPAGWLVLLLLVFPTGPADTCRKQRRRRKHGRARVRTRQGLVGKRRRRVALVAPGLHAAAASSWPMAQLLAPIHPRSNTDGFRPDHGGLIDQLVLFRSVLSRCLCAECSCVDQGLRTLDVGGGRSQLFFISLTLRMS